MQTVRVDLHAPLHVRCRFVCVSLCPFVHVAVRLCVFVAAWLRVCVFVCLYVSVATCLCVCILCAGVYLIVNFLRISGHLRALGPALARTFKEPALCRLSFLFVVLKRRLQRKYKAGNKGIY